MKKCDFPGVSFFIHGNRIAIGNISIFPTILTNAIVLQEENCTAENPLLKKQYLLTPLTEPYFVKDLYHFVNLSFYTEMSIIDEPPRLSLLDSTQEAGIMIDFVNKEQSDHFLDYMANYITLIKSRNVGFFKIISQYQSFYPSKEFFNSKNNLKSQFLNSPILTQDNSSFSAHSTFKSLIASYLAHHKTEKIPFEQAFQSLDSMHKFIKCNAIHHSQKAKVWSFLLNIDLNNIDNSLIQQYANVKKQWSSIRFSQFKRTKLFQDRIDQLSTTIIQFRQKLLSVVRDFSILQFTFNIVMSITHVYFDLSQHYTELLYMIRVLYSFLIEKIVFKGEKNDTYFVINEDTTLDSQSFETLVFWSMIAMIEKGKIHSHLFDLDNNHLESITDHIGDILFVVDPLLFHFYFGKAEKIKELVTILSTAMSNVLPLCDCSDLWIAALSSTNVSLFLDFIVIASLELIVHDSFLVGLNHESEDNLSYRKEFAKCKHWELIKAAFGLLDKYHDLMINE